MTESRTELLQWVNDLLSLSITKLEQCGSGAAYCQVFDSIYGDIPVGKVKFTGKREYEHIHNYKILQSAFNDHGVDKIIPVERLVKCKYQDNLDFLQWMKKYWDTYYPGGVYDAVQRRAKSDYNPNDDKPNSPSRREPETPTSPSRSLPSRRPSNRQSKDGISSLPQSPTRPTTRTETTSTTGDTAESPKRRTGNNNNHSSTSTAGSLTINVKPTKCPPSTCGDSEKPATRGRQVSGSIRQTNVSKNSPIQDIREDPYEEEPATPSPTQNKPAANRVANSNTASATNNSGRKVPVVGNAVNLRSRTSSPAREQQYDWEIQHNQILSLRKENNALRMELDNLRNVAHALERERNFYFSKLRDIEIVIRQKVDKIQIDRAVIPLLSSIQGIMYKTEDGFENISARNTGMGVHIDEFPQDHVRKDIDTLQYLDRMMRSSSLTGLSKPTYISSPPLRTNNFGTTATTNFVGQHEANIPPPGSLTRQDSRDWKQSSRPPSGSQQQRRLSETSANRSNIPAPAHTQPNLSYLKPQPTTEQPEALSTGAPSTDNDLLSALADVDTSSESRFQDAEDFDPSGSVHTSNTEITQLKVSVAALQSRSAASSRANLASKSVFGSGQALNKLTCDEAAGNILDETPPANFDKQLSELQLEKDTERVKSGSNLPPLPSKNLSSESLRDRVRENTKDPEGILNGDGDTWFGALAS